jgi:hypothetical protein
MRLIHTPNAMHWRRGDFEAHDSDAMPHDVLMIVNGCSRKGVYRTRYAFPKAQPRAGSRKVWRNSVESLQDPARFGIIIPRPTVNQAGTALGPRAMASRRG